MPIYEYCCDGCMHRFELRRSFSDDAPVSCPECNCDARRIFSPVPIIFKGSGFYSTDYRSNHGHSEPVSDSTETKTDSTEETKTDSTNEVKKGSND